MDPGYYAGICILLSSNYNCDKLRFNRLNLFDEKCMKKTYLNKSYLVYINITDLYNVRKC